MGINELNNLQKIFKTANSLCLQIKVGEKNPNLKIGNLEKDYWTLIPEENTKKRLINPYQTNITLSYSKPDSLHEIFDHIGLEKKQIMMRYIDPSKIDTLDSRGDYDVIIDPENSENKLIRIKGTNIAIEYQ